MPRRARIDQPGLIHHVTNRGVDRQPIFFDDADRVAFGRAIGTTHDRHGISALAYCLMDNHFHLLLACDEAVLSQSMQCLGSIVAHDTNRRHHRDGHLFGARFFSAVVDTPAYTYASLRYIERNSLDLPGVSSPTNYRWSSIRAHLGHHRRPDWLDSNRVLSWFGSIDSYRQFIDADAVVAEPLIIDPVRLGTMAMTVASSRAAPRTNQGWLDRTVLLLLAETFSSQNRVLIHQHLGLTTQRSVRAAIQRSQQRAQRDPSIDSIVDATRTWFFDQTESKQIAA
jgi:putative transposase